eukprot:GILI01009355.1.p1 GENE.GILI01009355.1~~GILI01009355.1.p1  ORF type:complete len:106 (-),score=31.09 GILI01009355.1:172-489(-)
MTGAAAAKVAPKSFNQIRNVAYLAAFFVGLSKGAAERTTSEASWAAYRTEQYKKVSDASHAHADHAHAHVQHTESVRGKAHVEKAEASPLEGIPVEIVNIFKSAH